jgi:DNA-directed RNA polymerase subunit beta
MTPPTSAARTLSAPTRRPHALSRPRRVFGPGDVLDAIMPNLNEMQCRSYAEFLQADVPAAERKNQGLQEVLTSIFPIKDFGDRSEIDFVLYNLDPPKYDTEECLRRSMTYAAPLRVTLRLSVFDVDEATGLRSIRDIKEQDVYLVDMPLMTDNGTFIVNGTERVVVSQMHRSPGVFFDHDGGKTHISGKYLFSARVIPYRGSWLDFEFDAKDLMYVRIDRRRKLPATTLLRALDSADTVAYRAQCEEQDITPDPMRIQGMGNEEILATFYDRIAYARDKDGWRTAFDPERMKGVKLTHSLVDAATGKVVAEAGEKLTPRQARKLAEGGLKEILVGQEEIVGRYLATDVLCMEKGEVFFEAGHEVEEEDFATFEANGIDTLHILAIDGVNIGPYMRNTLMVDKSLTRETALMDIYRVMRPGEPPTVESAENLFNALFFDPERYDLSPVGRVKMNARLDLGAPDDFRVLSQDDILSILRYLHGLKDGQGEVDDIDNLGNRRVRSVGELMENQVRIGLLRMERAIRERMSSVEIDTYMPHDLINSKPAQAAVREFFGSSQLSQFMDQTNPLSEITHKRRLSALGPGGLTRERAGFEVRDVHPTHYGRICPIETPEGPNIGLINSLATFARINPYGFIESPYRRVVDGAVTDEVVYMSAMEEAKYTIAQANAERDEKGRFVNDLISCRKSGESLMSTPEQIEFMDVSPKQIVSVAAALIPFLENDDANRALMGSNMQRQAVPLLRTEAPLVGTGLESTVARDSGAAVTARRAGTVTQVDATRIVIQASQRTRPDEPVVDIYKLSKFQRSNQDTCMNQRPIVKVGDVVAQGDIIADGPSTQHGELALGRNILVAFMPWHGYNFEDSILISERVVRDDVFTSIHIEEFEAIARDTKLGTEEITRDIPNVGEEALRQLDEAGIVHIGAEVAPGDILVGKVTPKGETPMTPEEKLLRAIFGEKASDVRDSSLRLPPGASGTIVDVSVFTRSGVDMDARAIANLQAEIERLQKDEAVERRTLEAGFYAHLERALVGQQVASAPKDAKLKKGQSITAEALEAVKRPLWRKIAVADDAVAAEVEALAAAFDKAIAALKTRFEDKVDKLQRGDDLPPGVMKIVKVHVAIKRKVQPGDKMAGRHGNKGVVSKIMPVEDMPFTEDGTPVDIVLNPLGVPSRMNVGQILETHLGWAAAGMGRRIGAALDAVDKKALADALKDAYGEREYAAKIAGREEEVAARLRDGVPMATPVFDGAHEEDVSALLAAAGLPTSGQVALTDGRTGQRFARPVTVGYMYMLKLHHLVDDKIHARSIGPYSLVTQQPLGGKAQFGGQRFGEMEVWALQAYGAAYTLQEMLTVKSDDVAGRAKVYESIVRGDDNFEVGIPESFNVLTKELKALGLNVDMKQSEGG